ncbi:MAG TPA: hypothetical protein DEG17_09435 [Cyanobacteria bacterium UBA11149]|nr:hypothetical protein [Cyanobacteria bacterium UBA11367]HBE56465.1 hypothetical protein [Cyanobacteria bacterium UBA11366]HBK65065.1 hypothetical protein [Cyanobacteria bacterium UBA11166]HBR75984.1 hypothetical protein [Cyanobacteria bacterium UBA11159]HBS72352.1 hypothetical protein [Cyanobacteria bacterium UBA11153]HBW89071.1 hypothetical protein [Cyanobacteria bacterium UBA11149]HCA96765.1 hypothetical protein [Cyanobacteria bacterium UBA9226]
MAITSCLSEFSLPELFQFLDHGSKTGLLTLRFQTDSQEKRVRHALLHQGRIVAVTNRLDHQCLLAMICQRGWISPEVLREQVNRCPANIPIGLYLKTHGFLQPEQLRLLFHAQVLRQVCGLFRLKDARFKFDAKATLPTTEMTGLSLSATEATLMGLRVLRDWRLLADKLPEATSALSRVVIGKRHLRLDSLEGRVWQLANGAVTLNAIATQLKQPVETIQQTAFRLISVGLVAEVPMLVQSKSKSAAQESPEPITSTVTTPKETNNVPDLSNSFMQNLLGFLRSSK